MGKVPMSPHDKLTKTLNKTVDQIKAYVMDSGNDAYFLMNAFLPAKGKCFNASSDFSGNMLTYASPSLNNINYLPGAIMDAVDELDPNIYEILHSDEKVPANAILLGGFVTITSHFRIQNRPFVFLGSGYWNQSKKDASERQDAIRKLTTNIRYASVQKQLYNGCLANKMDQYKFTANALDIIRTSLKTPKNK